MHFENMNSVVSLLKIEDWETRVFLVRCLWCELLPESLKPETGEPFARRIALSRFIMRRDQDVFEILPRLFSEHV